MNRNGKAAGPAVSGKRFEIGFDILNRWLWARQNGRTLACFFEDNFIKTIAIYGAGALGERLYEELYGSSVSVAYALDRMADLKNIPGLRIYRPDEFFLRNIDAIVITPVQDYWEIVGLLEEKTEAVLLSLEDIVTYCVDRI